MKQLLEFIEKLRQAHTSSRHADFRNFFCCHPQFPCIVEYLNRKCNFVEGNLNKDELYKVEGFLRDIFPFARHIADQLPLESRQKIYRSYVKDIFNYIEQKVFYPDEEIEVVYRELCQIDPEKIREDSTLEGEILKLRKEIAEMDNNPNEVIKEFQNEIANLDKEIEGIEKQIEESKLEKKAKLNLGKLGST